MLSRLSWEGRNGVTDCTLVLEEAELYNNEAHLLVVLLGPADSEDGRGARCQDSPRPMSDPRANPESPASLPTRGCPRLPTEQALGEGRCLNDPGN